MDDDIRAHLKELSKHVEAVGRSIGSTKIDIDGLQQLSATLKLDKKALDIWINIAKDRLK